MDANELDALAAKITAIPPGKSLGSRGSDTYYLVANRPEGYVVECGWTVRETHDDDPGSYAYNPFKGRTAMPAWIGRRSTAQDAVTAAQTYQEYKAAVSARTLPPGEQIGSVVR